MNFFVHSDPAAVHVFGRVVEGKIARRHRYNSTATTELLNIGENLFIAATGFVPL